MVTVVVSFLGTFQLDHLLCRTGATPKEPENRKELALCGQKSGQALGQALAKLREMVVALIFSHTDFGASGCHKKVLDATIKSTSGGHRP